VHGLSRSLVVGYTNLGVPITPHGWLKPMISGAAMALSSLLVIVNFSLLRGYRQVWA
jgi:cation transport ATPase